MARLIDVYFQIIFGLMIDMGCIYSRIVNDSSNIEILHFTPQDSEYDYVRPVGTITVTFDEKFKVPVIHLDFDGWISNSVCLLWENSVQRDKFLILEITPLNSPTTSNSAYSSGFDTVF